jgi:hypothetical protein
MDGWMDFVAWIITERKLTSSGTLKRYQIEDNSNKKMMLSTYRIQ